MLKFQTEITHMLIFGRNYWSSCRVYVVRIPSHKLQRQEKYVTSIKWHDEQNSVFAWSG